MEGQPLALPGIPNCIKMNEKIRVLMFEDNKKYRESLALAYDHSDSIYFAGAYPDATEASKLIRKHEPDVVLMDIQMPGITGIEALQKVKVDEPETKILMLTAFDDNHKIFSAICFGASGYALKSANYDELEKAIIDVYMGGGYFTPSIAGKVISFFKNELISEQVEYIELTKTEMNVLKCMAEGMSYKMIEAELNKSYAAVHFHIKNIYKKLHVNSMTEAVIKAIKNNLI